MAYKFNPFTGTFDDVTSGGGGGSTSPGGSTTQVQFNNAGAFGGDADLTWNSTTNVLGVTGDVNLSDGGTYTTTLQTITPTAARTISLPDATGTVALVAGSSGQLLWNNAGVNAGASTLTYDGSILTTSGRFINSYNATASSPAKAFTGTWFTGGTGTTTKPQVLIEPTGATSTAWSTSGTGLGVNAASGFAGNLLDLQVNGTSVAKVSSTGSVTLPSLNFSGADITGLNACKINIGGSGQFRFTGASSSDVISFIYDAGLRLKQNLSYSWASGSDTQGGGDLFLFRDAANTLAQRNGTAAQTTRVYNTFTDASNYQRTSLTDSSTGLVINQEFAGTGAARTNLLDLQVNGTSRISVDSAGFFRSSSEIGSKNNAGNWAGFTASTFAVKSVTSSNRQIGLDGFSLYIQATGLVQWTSSTTDCFSGGDVALARDAAGVVKVTNASSGNGTLLAQHRLAGTAPATASSTGTAGDIRYDASYIYICTATDTWKRALLTTW